MYRALILIFAVLILLNAVTRAFAGTTAEKDAAAVADLQSAITAMGGDKGLAQLKDSVVTGAISPTKGSPVKPASFVWKTLGAEFRYETTRDPNAYIFASGFGKPAVSKNGKVEAVFYQEAQGCPPFQLPALVLSLQLADATSSIIDKGETLLAGKPALQVQTSLTASDSKVSDAISAVTQQTWYFDASTGLPLRVEYRIPDAKNASTWTNAALDLSDFKEAGILTVPFTMTYSEEGVPLQVFSIATVDFNVGLDPAEFDLLGGGK